jgi:pyridoxal phosphate enzyme (YggS family)
MTSIRDNLQIIGAKIEKFSLKYQHSNNAVKLLAVSKRHSAEKIREAYDAGQTAFGENYVQELLEKNQQLSDLEIEWHYIGPLQSNKSKKISEVATWVHTVDRLKIAQGLNHNRPEHLAPLSICLQLNISRETSKSGVTEAELLGLAKEVLKLPRLKLRGLMVIPAPETNFDKQREVFAKVTSIKQQLEKELQKSLNSEEIELDTLSMGMSDDMEAAIAEGATIVRIGTAIFGAREN